MHPQFDAGRRAPGDAEQLDPVTKFLGVADILLGEPGNALGIGLVELHRNAVGDRRHDGELVRGIHTLDVEGRVGFRIAEALRLGEHVFEARTLLAHFRKDEVRGPVDDSSDPLDTVGAQPFAQGLDDRHTAGNCGFEGNHHPLFLRRQENLVAVCRQQRLVGSDDVLAVADGRQNQVLRDFGAPDQFDHDVDIWVAYHLECVIGNLGGIANQLARPAQVLVGDHLDDDSATGPPGNLFLVAA